MLKDADIREPLFEYLEEYFGKIRIFEEKRMGKSRADIMMILPGQIYGVEIKSDADTYARLESQIKDYDTYFDKNYVVVGTSHAAHIEEHVPKHWGIITVEEMEDIDDKDKADFYMLRQAADNPKASLDKKMRFLWRMELAKIQEMNEMPKYANMSRENVIKKIMERTNYPENKKGYIDASMLHIQLSDILFERDYTNVQEQINEYRSSVGKPVKRKRRRKYRKSRV